MRLGYQYDPQGKGQRGRGYPNTGGGNGIEARIWNQCGHNRKEDVEDTGSGFEAGRVS